MKATISSYLLGILTWARNGNGMIGAAAIREAIAEGRKLAASRRSAEGDDLAKRRRVWYAHRQARLQQILRSLPDQIKLATANDIYFLRIDVEEDIFAGDGRVVLAGNHRELVEACNALGLQACIEHDEDTWAETSVLVSWTAE